MEETKKTAVKVGLFVIISITVLILMIIYLSQWQIKKAGFYVNLKFNFLNNIALRAPVLIAGGITVGYVEDIYQKDLETFVRVYLDKELEGKIPKRPESMFTIFSSSLMGQKYINLTIGEAQEGDEFLKDGDTYVAIDPPSIDQMMLSFSSWFDGKNGGQVLAEIMHQSKLFISNLNAIASENRSDIRVSVKQARESFTTLAVQLDLLMSKLNILTGNVSDITTRNKVDIEIMLENLAQISRDMNIITQRINSGRGSVGKFVSDDELYKNANEAVLNARDLFKMIKDKPWMLIYKE